MEGMGLPIAQLPEEHFQLIHYTCNASGIRRSTSRRSFRLQ